MTNAELLTCDCDVLIHAALENQITSANAADIKAKVVFELANGPTTTEADDLLFARLPDEASGKAGMVPVVPDILANAGGWTVSTYEWEQNLKGEHWSEQEVFSKLKTNLEAQALHVWEEAHSVSTDLRRGAFLLALKRLEEAMK